jgi:hypothetical protein
MKRISGFNPVKLTTVLAFVLLMSAASDTNAQICTNPANDFISITGAAINAGSPVKFFVFDLAGKKQSDRQLRAGENSITVNSLKTGIYIINIVAADGTMSTQKFVKQ